MNTFSPITNYLITGQVPDGIRPDIMEKLANITAKFRELEE